MKQDLVRPHLNGTNGVEKHQRKGPIGDWENLHHKAVGMEEACRAVGKAQAAGVQEVSGQHSHIEGLVFG